jgi:hypothetical protein
MSKILFSIECPLSNSPVTVSAVASGIPRTSTETTADPAAAAAAAAADARAPWVDGVLVLDKTAGTAVLDAIEISTKRYACHVNAGVKV